MSGIADVGATAQDREDPAQTLRPRLRDAEYIEVGVQRCPEIWCAVDSKPKIKCTPCGGARYEE